MPEGLRKVYGEKDLESRNFGCELNFCFAHPYLWVVKLALYQPITGLLFCGIVFMSVNVSGEGGRGAFSVGSVYIDRCDLSFYFFNWLLFKNCCILCLPSLEGNDCVSSVCLIYAT